MNSLKTPVRETRNEFKTPRGPPYHSTPLSYNKITISSFLRKEQSSRGPISNEAGRSGNPLYASCDRFIANRRFFDAEMSNLLLTSIKKQPLELQGQKPNLQNDTSPPQMEQFTQWREYYAWSEKTDHRKTYKNRVVDLMMDGKRGRPKVLNFSASLKKREPERTTMPPRSLVKRHIPRFPEKILDMPQISQDFGTNVMHWDNKGDFVVVGLNKSVFMWHPVTRFCVKVPVRIHAEAPTCFQADSKITAVSLDQNAKFIAMSTKIGSLMIFVLDDRRVFEMIHMMPCEPPHTDRSCYFASLAWLSPCRQQPNRRSVYLGSRCGQIFSFTFQNNEDTEVENRELLHRKIQELYKVRGPLQCISFSRDSAHLAVLSFSGYLTVFKVVAERIELETEIRAHDGLSLSMAWCPWQDRYIATSGMQDLCVKVWNFKSNKLIVEKKTKMPITCITWSELQKELLTGHSGDDAEQDLGSYVQIWKFPSMQLVCRLIGHQARVIYMGIGLSQSLLASIGADQTLLLWRCFDNYTYKNNKWVSVVNERKEKKELTSPDHQPLSSSSSQLLFNIR